MVKCFIVKSKDIFDKKKNPNLSLSAKDILKNNKIAKREVKNMNLEGLTKGELFIVKWQYRLLGDFKTALIQVISLADSINSAKLASGFPDEVAAYRNYTQVKDWWPNLQKKIGINWD